MNSEREPRIAVIRRMEVHKYWRAKHDELLIEAINDALALGIPHTRIAVYAGVSRGTVLRISTGTYRPKSSARRYYRPPVET